MTSLLVPLVLTNAFYSSGQFEGVIGAKALKMATWIRISLALHKGQSFPQGSIANVKHTHIKL